MSRGLGAVQKAILTALERAGGGSSVADLAIRVFHPELIGDNGELNNENEYILQGRRIILKHPYSRAEYVTVDRAVRTLERRGLVRTKIHVPKRPYGLYLGPRWKSVELISVDRQAS